MVSCHPPGVGLPWTFYLCGINSGGLLGEGRDGGGGVSVPYRREQTGSGGFMLPRSSHLNEQVGTRLSASSVTVRLYVEDVR